MQALVAVTLIGSLEGFGFITLTSSFTVLGLLRAAAYAGFIVITGIAITTTGRIRLGRTPLPLATLALLAAASLLIDDNPGRWAIRMVVIVGSLGVGWLYQQRGGLEPFLRLVVPILVAASLVSAAVALAWPAIGQNPQGAWIGVFVHKNDLGRVAALTIIVLYMANRRGLLSRRAYVAGMAIGVVDVIMSDSATVLVVLAAVIPTGIAAALLRRHEVVPDMVVGLGAFVLLVLAGALMVGGADQVFDTVFGILGRDTDGNSLALRRSVWQVAYQVATEHFWTGQGVSFEDLSGGSNLVFDNGSSQVVWDPKHAHNAIIDVWLRLGFFGVVAVVWLLAWFVGRGFALARRGDGSVLLFASTMVAMSTTYSILLAREVLLWVVFSVVALNRDC